MGIYLLVRGLDALIFILGTSWILLFGQRATQGWGVLGGEILMVVLYGILGFELIKSAEFIATHLYAPDVEDRMEKNADAFRTETLMQVALSAVGVFLVATAIAEVPALFRTMIWPAARSSMGVGFGPSAFLRIVLLTAMGFYLILGAQGLVAAIQRLRRAGPVSR